jgi:uncharacterized membrane protein YiaA
MKRLFRREIYGLLAAATGAAVSFYADVKYLPSVLMMVVGFLMMGIFAELEDEVLKRIDDHSIESHDWHLTLLRFIRTVVLLAIGVLIFAALGSQF